LTEHEESDQSAFALAFDHRNSLRHWYLAITGAAQPDPVVLSTAKVLVADALLASAGEVAGRPMLLIDEEYGAEAISAVRAGGPRVQVIVPAEVSGQPEFIFEHGAAFGERIAQTGPDIVKALVRYNPAADQERNARSRDGLVKLGSWLADHDRPLMLELLVPPVPEQAVPGFDDRVRPELTRQAIGELRAAGLSPAYWKVEGQPSTDAFASLAAATDGGRCLVLGRGEDFDAVARWVAMAAAAEGFNGFAVGRTIWSGPLAGWLTGQVSRDDAVAQIRRNYLHFTRVYRDNRRAPV
jgi:myo-inositol catabolism protein IolC